MKKETEEEKPFVKKRTIMETLRILLCNNASGVYTIDELERIREDEIAKRELSFKVASNLPADIRTTEEYRNADWWKKLRLLLSSILADKRGKCKIPDHVLRDLAKALLPNIIAFFNTEEGKAEFEKWKEDQKAAEKTAEFKQKASADRF